MPRVDAVVSCPIQRTFRTDQCAGMFDLKIEDKASEIFGVEIPDENEDWQIGCIVGPSGSGKTSIARQAFGKRLFTGCRWPRDKSVLDGFDKDLSIKEITHTLTSVGFASPPAWLKPYHVLSNGEKFRCDLARALLGGDKLVVYDEFTSVVDRTVGKIGSAAVSKSIRKGRIKQKFVAVTCHYDVVEWLEPDWVVDMASGRLARGRLRRPQIRLTIAPVHRSFWALFRRHHYLNTALGATAQQCYVAFWEDRPIAFSCWFNSMTRSRRKGDMREHRTVVLPDFQGVGIGNRLSEFCASIFQGAGYRAFSTTSHPAVIHSRSKSPLWKRLRLSRVSRMGHNATFARTSKTGRYEAISAGRVTAGFLYIGPGMDKEVARRFMELHSIRQVRALVYRWPGATVRLLTRLSDLSSTGVHYALAELIERGDIVQQGRGGSHGRQHAFYPVCPRKS